VQADYVAKWQGIEDRVVRELEKGIMLRQLDTQWKEHIAALDYLRQGIHLRGYAQRNPKQEYKREAFEMFSDMLDRVKHDTIALLSKIQIRRPEDVAAVEAPPSPATNLRFQHAAAPTLAAAVPPPQPRAAPAGMPLPSGGEPEPASPFVRAERKVGRNEPCPCGSGKKFKQCHGRLE
jgi:preprotein translocase subunit SecA